MTDQATAAAHQVREALRADRVAAGTRPHLEVHAAHVRAQLATAEQLARIADRLDEVTALMRDALRADHS